MLVKFFIYEIDSGNIINILPNKPDNNYYSLTNEIYYQNIKIMSGINWSKLDWEYSSTGLELNESKKYKYNFSTKEIIER